MNDNVLRLRLPPSLSDRLKQKAVEHGRTSSDVVREGLIIQLRRLERQLPSCNSHTEPPQAA